nr:MAG TPA: DNA binding protein [Caudoviricetes sp.]
MKITKDRFIRQLAERSHQSLAQTEAFVNQFCQLVTEELSQGNEVQLRNFGTWRVKTLKERLGHHPQTGEIIYIRERKKIVFKAGLELLDNVDFY